MKRWQNYVDGMAEEPEGPYVLWEDHAAEEWEHHHTHDDCWICALLARADAFLRGSGAEVARKELLGALAVASLLKAAGHALRSYQYGNGSTELAKNIADKIDAAFADVPPAPSREKGARDGGERGSGAEQGIFQAGFARGLAEGHGPEKPQEAKP